MAIFRQRKFEKILREYEKIYRQGLEVQLRIYGFTPNGTPRLNKDRIERSEAEARMRAYRATKYMPPGFSTWDGSRLE